MATLVQASTDWQVFVNKNGGMCKKFDELHVLLVIKIDKELAILYFRASYSRRYVQLEELESLFLRKFLIFGIIYHL